MAETAAGIMVDTLLNWGVEVVFGLPGDGINGIMEALRRRQDKIRFVQVRHEEAAAFMACGYAKYTGRLGVCLATSGPGGIHLLNGLYDAKLDGQPVLAITGHHFHDLIDTHAQQDVDLDKLFMDVAVYNARIMGVAHVAPVTNLACRTALSYRGVAHINFPVDMQDFTSDERSQRDVPGHTSATLAHGAGLPAEEDLQRAGEILNSQIQDRYPRRARRARRRRRAGSSRRNPGSADHQGAAGQSRRSRRQSLYNRRHRFTRHTRFAGSAGRMRRAFTGGHVFPLH